MTETQAETLVTRLIAAYPRERLDEANVALYVERLMTLEQAEIASAAVTALIEESPRFPTIAEIRTEYRARRRREILTVPALPSPEPTEEDRHRMAEEARELARNIGRREPI